MNDPRKTNSYVRPKLGEVIAAMRNLGRVSRGRRARFARTDGPEETRRATRRDRNRDHDPIEPDRESR